MALEKLVEAITVPADLAIKHSITPAEKTELVEALSAYLSNAEDDRFPKKLTEAEAQNVAKSFLNAGGAKNKWSFPVSRFDYINENRRRYGRPLWERVIRDQKKIWEGSVGLADHPGGDSDPMFKDSAVVWSNLRFSESGGAEDNLVWADAIFVGPHGRLAEEILEAGGRVGFSTAGLGELARMTENGDGQYREFYDVIPDTFILERPADLVPNPSQDVYGFLEMKIRESVISDQVPLETRQELRMALVDGHITPEDAFQALVVNNNIPEEEARSFVNVLIRDTDFEPLMESDGGGEGGGDGVGVTSAEFQAEAPENVISTTSPGGKKRETESTATSAGDTSEEGKQKMKTTGTGMTSYEERRYREDIERFIEKAAALVDPRERLKEYEEIQKYVQSTPETFIADLKEKLIAALDKSQQDIAALYEKGEKFQTIFGTDLGVDDVQKTLNELSTMKTTLTEASYDWKAVSEKLAEKLKTFVEAVETLRNRPTVEAHEALTERVQKVTLLIKRQQEAKKVLLTKHQLQLAEVEQRMRSYIKENLNTRQQLEHTIQEMRDRNMRLQKEKAKLVDQFESVTVESMAPEQRYLFEGAKGVGKQVKEHTHNGSRLTEAALSNARGRDHYEVRNYYNDLLKKHGMKILPHSEFILEARDYKDAVQRYLKISEKLNPGWDPELIMDLDNPTIWEFLQNQTG